MMYYIELICAAIGALIVPLIIVYALMHDDGEWAGRPCMTDDCPRSMQYDR